MLKRRKKRLYEKRKRENRRHTGHPFRNDQNWKKAGRGGKGMSGNLSVKKKKRKCGGMGKVTETTLYKKPGLKEYRQGGGEKEKDTGGNQRGRIS